MTLFFMFPQGPPLSKRTEWAATFEHLIGDTLRTDCPLELPDVPPPHETEWARQQALPIDEHARGVIKMLCDMNGGVDPESAHVHGPSDAASRHCDELGICLSTESGCGVGVRPPPHTLTRSLLRTRVHFRHSPYLTLLCARNQPTDRDQRRVLWIPRAHVEALDEPIVLASQFVGLSIAV